MSFTQEALIVVRFLCESDLLTSLDQLLVPLGNVELDIELKLYEADGAKGSIADFDFEVTVGALHRTMIVDAMLQSKHVSNLMRCGPTGSL